MRRVRLESLSSVVGSASGGLVGAPFDGAESSAAAQEAVGEADGFHRLVPVAQVGKPRIPGRHDILEPDGVGPYSRTLNPTFQRVMISCPK